jgi:hypothetical protein
MLEDFVEDYVIWTYHSEKAPPPAEILLDEIRLDIQFDRLFDAYDDFDESSSDDDDGGECHGDGVDNGGSDDKFDDGDFLSQFLRQTKTNLLVGNAKGLANFEVVKKLAEENVYKHT